MTFIFVQIKPLYLVTPERVITENYRMLDFLYSFAKKEGDSPNVAFQKRLLGVVAFFLFLCGSVWTVMYYSIYGNSVPFIAAYIFVINVVALFFISHKMKNHLPLTYSLFYACLLAPLFASWAMGGLQDGGFVLAWGILCPLGILIFASLRGAIIGFIVFSAAILYTLYGEHNIWPTIQASETIVNFMYSMNIIVSFAVIFSACAWFIHVFRKEKQLSDDLLHNILPNAVIEEMKDHGESKAKAFTMVTVMFTDFVGFTEVSQKVSAELLVAEIHYCFSAFDKIISKYSIEKIKTIGDAYLCASGLPISNYTHAKDMISAAVEIRDFMEQRKQEKQAKGEIPFDIRVGLHTGPVVAGIVGVRKFQYDIWGDTVNTASRVETNSEPGKINISQSTYELIKDNPKYEFEHRGKIVVKGKGELEMYFVEKSKKKKK